MVIAAALATFATADEGAVRATIERNFPPNTVQGIAATPIPGLFEVAVDGQVVYVTNDGRYILAGPLVDAKERVNLTEARLEKLNAIPWDGLPLDLAIKRTKGSGTRRIAIFEDPDCPYCKALEQTLNEIDDVTVYVRSIRLTSCTRRQRPGPRPCGVRRTAPRRGTTSCAPARPL